MGKLDELLRSGASNIAESMGAGVTRGPGAAPLSTSSTPAQWQGVAKSKNAVEIPLEKIAPDPDQPREEFDEDALNRLAESLKTRGQLQPIRVRWDEGRGAYMILIGERRWRAAKLAGLPTVSAVVVEGTIDPAELLAIQLIENCLREDLKPIEQAKAFKALMERNGWTVRQVAQELAIDHFERGPDGGPAQATGANPGLGRVGRNCPTDCLRDLQDRGPGRASGSGEGRRRRPAEEGRRRAAREQAGPRQG